MAELGAGAGSGFPAVLDTDTTLEANEGEAGASLQRAECINDAYDAIINIETELGVTPAGAYTNVATRLDAYSTPIGNLIINGDFRVAQQGLSFTSATTPANNDDTYLWDQRILLAEGNDIVDVTYSTACIPTGSHIALKLDVETGNKKFGIFHPLEGMNSSRALGKNVSLSFKARITGTSIGNIKAGIVSWQSTLDSITSDIISAWGADGVTPTLAANWTFENTPAALTPTTSYQTFEIENIAIDTASTTNIGVFIWCDDLTTTVGDFLYITDIQLEIAPSSGTYKVRSVQEEFMLCQRYYERHGGVVDTMLFSSVATAAAQVFDWFLPFKATKRVAPTMVVNGTWALVNCTGPLINDPGIEGYSLRLTAAAAGQMNLATDSTDDWISADARL